MLGKDKFLGGLGIYMNDWEAGVKRDVEHSIGLREYGLLQPEAYLIDRRDPRGSARVTNAFQQRISALEKYHRKVNGTGLIREDLSHLNEFLEGTTFLKLNFDGGQDLGSAAVNREFTNRWVLPIKDRIENAEGRVIEINYPTENAKYNVRGWGNPRYAIHNVLRGLKPVIMTVDGYGKYAARQWGFQMHDGFLEWRDTFACVFVRSSEDQEKKDAGYGSHWGYKFPKINPDNVEEKRRRRIPMPYDRDRFVRLAGAIDRGITGVRSGESVVVQAPNMFGKTTALRQLAGLERPGLRVGLVPDDGGEVLDYVGYRQMGGLGRGNNLILDEAGRMEIPGSIARGKVDGWRQIGVNVLRVYPGNVKTPEGVEVIGVR